MMMTGVMGALILFTGHSIYRWRKDDRKTEKEMEELRTTYDLDNYATQTLESISQNLRNKSIAPQQLSLRIDFGNGRVLDYQSGENDTK